MTERDRQVMKKPRQSAHGRWGALSILIAVSACGGGDDGGPPSPGELAPMSTLAYVMSECRGDRQGGTIRQRLQIRQGEHAPITVDAISPTAQVSASIVTICTEIGALREGVDFVDRGVFDRLGVAPNGSQVVFEVTDDRPTTLFPPNSLPAELNGIFAVRADGTDLRRLGPASREPPTRPGTAPAFTFAFSPNGRTIAYTDRGPSRDNQDAVQIFTLDLATGDRRQVTQLPPAVQRSSARTCCPVFHDDRTIGFLTIANVDGNNPDGENVNVTVDINDPELKLTVAPPAVAVPGSQIVTRFQITGEASAVLLRLPGTPVNPGGLGAIQEVFAIDGHNVLQLTDFRRQDTWNPTLSADGQRVFFSASADPLGTNPTENCQIFSIDRNGGDLRQLTHFREGPYSPTGCHSGPPPDGCFVLDGLGRDTPSDTLVFDSTCDPFGTNPYGLQLFAMQPDGTGLRQLTETQGYTADASGAVAVEVPFPWAHPGQQDND